MGHDRCRQVPSECPCHLFLFDPLYEDRLCLLLPAIQIRLHLGTGLLKTDPEEELAKATLLTHGGQVVHANFGGKAAATPKAAAKPAARKAPAKPAARKAAPKAAAKAQAVAAPQDKVSAPDAAAKAEAPLKSGPVSKGAATKAKPARKPAAKGGKN